jgi:hypothetical protein
MMHSTVEAQCEPFRVETGGHHPVPSKLSEHVIPYL